MRRCYLSKNYNELSSAGNKAKTDIEKVMDKLGFVNVGLKQTHIKNKVGAFFVTLFSVLKSIFSLSKGDMLVLQYPFKKYYAFACNIAHFRGAKVVTQIHDLGSFRRQKLTVEKEIKRLEHSDYIIAHNNSMIKWLEENGCKIPLGSLEIFDYLSKSQNHSVCRDVNETIYNIVYAGALHRRKNAFLYELKESSVYQFSLYGGGFDVDANLNKSLTYKGFIPSDELIAKANGDFGLVWDGDSLDTCSGNFGEYLQYNNPHKVSFYIRCHLPVIIWSKAAMATFVTQHGIGICIDSLNDLNHLLSSLSDDDYQNMKNRTIEVSKRLSEGYYFEHAIKKAEQVIQS